LDAAIDIAKVLGDAAPGVNLLKAGIKKAKGKPAPRAAVTVRKAFDAYLKSVPEGNGDAAATPTSGRSGPSPEEALKMKELQNQLASLKREKEAALKQQKALSSVVAVAAGASSAACAGCAAAAACGGSSRCGSRSLTSVAFSGDGAITCRLAPFAFAGDDGRSISSTTGKAIGSTSASN
jgi:hypothetical protein